jgi:hypothetical protein
MTQWLSFEMEKGRGFLHAEYELVVVAENSKLSAEIPLKTRLELHLALFQRQTAKNDNLQ